MGNYSKYCLSKIVIKKKKNKNVALIKLTHSFIRETPVTCDSKSKTGYKSNSYTPMSYNSKTVDGRVF